MKTLVLTGGIASGKSTVLQTLLSLGQGTLDYFDCDREVARLYQGGRVPQLLRHEFGDECLNIDGSVNRAWLRQVVFSDACQRERLNSLIHPMLEQECLARIEQVRHNKCVRGFVIDAPLFYESGVNYGQDAVCVVGLSPETQRMRLNKRNGFDDGMIQAMLSSQWPLTLKLQHADFVIWNEGSRPLMLNQTQRLYQHFFHE